MKMVFVRFSGFIFAMLLLALCFGLLVLLTGTLQLGIVIAGVITAIVFLVGMIGVRLGMRKFAFMIGVSEETWKREMGFWGTIDRAVRSYQTTSQVTNAINSSISPSRTCGTCGGSGQARGGTCPECGGKGTVIM
jgi:hypothetical protein